MSLELINSLNVLHPEKLMRTMLQRGCFVLPVIQSFWIDNRSLDACEGGRPARELEIFPRLLVSASLYVDMLTRAAAAPAPVSWRLPF